MSERAHDAIDCSYALQRVFLYLDGEIGEVDAAEARRHLADCAPCFREYNLEEAVKFVVKHSCQREVVPEGLRGKIIQRLQTVILEVEDNQPAEVEDDQPAEVEDNDLDEIEGNHSDKD